MKALFAVAVYMLFTTMLGFIMATIPPRWTYEKEALDDES